MTAFKMTIVKQYSEVFVTGALSGGKTPNAGFQGNSNAKRS